MIIAKIKLSPGNAGWYDALTNIHLTIANPIGEIKAGMNTNNIKKGLTFRTIELIQGSLEEEEIIAQIEAQTHNEVIQPSTAEKAVASEEVIIDETVTEEKPKKSSKKKAKA